MYKQFERDITDEIHTLFEMLNLRPDDQALQAELDRILQVWEEYCRRLRAELDAEAGFDEDWKPNLLVDEDTEIPF